MPLAFAILIGCQLLGEILRQTFHLPLPGPLIGMLLLMVALVMGGRNGAALVHDTRRPLVQAANGLITYMGLLFVPAGVGVIAEIGTLKQEWFPIVAGLLFSTVLGLAVTGLVMQHVSRFVEGRQQTASSSVDQWEAH
jgi:holin-like protein